MPEFDVMEADVGIRMTLMQDNTPCHKSKVVMDFLA